MRQFKALVLFFVALVALSSCTKIDAANEGVLINQYGDNKGTPVAIQVKGRVWYNPFTQDVEEYPAFMQQADYEAFSVNAADGSVFHVDPMLNFRIAPGKAADIYVKYRKGIEALIESVILTKTKDAFKNVFNLYTTDSLIKNRNKIDKQVEDALRASLEKENFLLGDLTFGLHYPKSITDAIDAKNASVQKAQQAENELREAEMNAKKKLIEAEAEAQANRLKQQTLTPLLIQQQFIEKWDGKTPLYGSAPVNFKSVQ